MPGSFVAAIGACSAKKPLWSTPGTNSMRRAFAMPLIRGATRIGLLKSDGGAYLFGPFAPSWRHFAAQTRR
jgi:hypothetical protein